MSAAPAPSGRVCRTAAEAFAAGQRDGERDTPTPELTERLGRLLSLAAQGPTKKNGRPAA